MHLARQDGSLEIEIEQNYCFAKFADISHQITYMVVYQSFQKQDSLTWMILTFHDLTSLNVFQCPFHRSSNLLYSLHVLSQVLIVPLNRYEHTYYLGNLRIWTSSNENIDMICQYIITKNSYNVLCYLIQKYIR